MSLPRPVVMITDSVCDVTRDSGAPGVGDKVIRDIITELSLTSSMVREVRVTVSVTCDDDDDPEYDDTGDTVTVRLDWTSLR